MTDKKAKPEPDEAEQSKRFVETARELESDESGKAFERAISQVTKNAKTKEGSSKPS